MVYRVISQLIMEQVVLNNDMECLWCIVAPLTFVLKLPIFVTPSFTDLITLHTDGATIYVHLWECGSCSKLVPKQQLKWML